MSVGAAAWLRTGAEVLEKMGEHMVSGAYARAARALERGDAAAIVLSRAAEAEVVAVHMARLVRSYVRAGRQGYPMAELAERAMIRRRACLLLARILREVTP